MRKPVPHTFNEHIDFNFKPARRDLSANRVASVAQEPRAHVAYMRAKQRPREERQKDVPTTFSLVIAPGSMVPLSRDPMTTSCVKQATISVAIFDGYVSSPSTIIV